MRATEFITEGAQVKGTTIGDVLLRYAASDDALAIRAYTKDKNPIGFVKFYKENGKDLDPQNLWVNDDYRGKGVAKTMYDYLKSEGYRIIRSQDQTAAGKRFWDTHRGEDVHVWEDKEVISELFQPGKNFKWGFRGSEEATAYFTVGDVEYLWYASVPNARVNPTAWDIVFRVSANTDDKEKLFGRTGTGNEKEVMSTVVDITRQFLEQYGNKVLELRFSAKEDSRASLYVKMVKRLLPDWNLHTKRSPTGQGFMFYLTSPKAYDNVDEACVSAPGGQGRWMGKEPYRHLVEKDLEEAFNSKIQYTVDKAAPYMFQTSAVIGDRKVIYGGDQTSEGIWEIAFYERGIPGGPKKSDTFGKSGSGNELQVFSFVIDSTKELIARYQPEEITFTSSKSDENRSSLYARLLKRFPVPGYTFVGVRHRGQDDEFVIKRTGN